MHIARIILTALLIMASFAQPVSAEDTEFEWDSTSASEWTPSFRKVEIPSAKDGSVQNAYFRPTTSAQPQPLIVSLHTWSGGYSQKDPMAADVEARDWNYIHPHFRGFNNKPEAMVSDLVLADIDDAIAYALANANVDPDQIHIVGVSGGGLATLACYMELSRSIRSFNAWVPISDLEAWYWESRGRRFNYADHIMAAIGADGKIDEAEARRRSPLYKSLPADARRAATLRIYAGIHDGHIGCVPVSHSVNFYNRVAGEWKYSTSNLDEIYRLAQNDSSLVSKDELLSLLAKRINPAYQQHGDTLLGRHVHLRRSSGRVSLIIFEGEHEQLPGALSLIDVE